MIAIAAPALALAAPALDGATGLLRVPTAETAAMGRVSASLGLEMLYTYDGFAIAGLPVGFAAGLARRVEVGGHVDRDRVTPRPQYAPARGTAGFHARLRAIDPVGVRPAIAVQGALRGIGQAPVGEVSLIAMFDAPRTLWVAAFGPRVSAEGWSGWQGAGGALRLGQSALLVDEQAEFDPSGLQYLSARGGIRLPAGSRASVLAWAGGGHAVVAPWAGGGLSLQLTSSDPRREDTDRDTVEDGTDRCRYTPEDLDGFEDLDGCPDPDNDGDGIEDRDDPTPNGEPAPEPDALPGDTPSLKMRIKQRPMPGPIDPARRGLQEAR